MNNSQYVPSGSVAPAFSFCFSQLARVLGALLLATLGSACSGQPTKQAAAAAAPATPAKLRLGVALPSPAHVTNFANTFAAESLVGIGWNGRPVDRTVMAWEWEPDNRGIALTLRPNLKFHDGMPIDIAYFRTSLEATFKAPTQPGTNVSFKSVRGVELDPAAPDRVIVRLSRPEAFLLDDLANSSLPHPKNPEIGTGPYRLVAADQKVRLESFPDYYRGRPRIDTIEIENFGEQRGAWAALMRGDLEAVHQIAPQAVDFLQAEGQTVVKTYSFMRPYYLQLMFNVRHPILKSPVVRQALSYAIDRQAVVDLALYKQGTPADGPVWPYHWAYSTALKTYTHNSEAATLRLDSAGLKQRKSAAPGQMPSRFRIRCLTLANDARYEKIALILQKQLYEIGVDLAIEALPGRELVNRIDSGDFDTVLVERTSGRSLAWTYLSFHSSESPSGYTAADEVLDRLRSTTSEPIIRAAVSDLQQILHDDPPAIFIAWPQVARVVSSKFEVPSETGRSNEAGRDVLSSLWQWRPAGSSQ